jgi:hypothetical protein
MDDNRYMTPDELSWHLEQQGVTYTARYYRAVRRYGIRIGDSPFVGNTAQPAAVVEWLRRHPEFTVRLGESDARPVGIASL